MYLYLYIYICIYIYKGISCKTKPDDQESSPAIRRLVVRTGSVDLSFLLRAWPPRNLHQVNSAD